MKNFILVNDTTTQNNWGCHSTTKHFRRFFTSRGFVEKGTILLSDLHGNGYCRKTFNDFKDIDFLAINGEGSLYDLQQKGINIINYIRIAKSRNPRIKVLLLNSTFDLKNNTLRDMVKETSNLVDLYGARESVSFNNLKQLQINNVILQPDFLYEKINYSVDKEDYIVIGGNSNYYRPDRPHYDALGAYEYLINNLINKNKILLYSADNSDINFMKPLSEKFGLTHISCSEHSWEKGFDVLSKAKFSISGRYHPTIMSLCGLTPCFFISANNCKMLGTHNYFHQNEFSYLHSHSLKEGADKILQWANSVDLQNKSIQETKLGLDNIKILLENSKSEINKVLS